jgi:hypothetical protein
MQSSLSRVQYTIEWPDDREEVSATGRASLRVTFDVISHEIMLLAAFK